MNIKQKVTVNGVDKMVDRSQLSFNESGVAYTHYNSDMSVNSDTSETPQEGYELAKSELESSDIEIKYHLQGSKRAKLTVQDWYDYQEALRDYATCDDDGNYSILTAKPTKPE